jgi:capsular polysaccharide biosynthesis protein
MVLGGARTLVRLAALPAAAALVAAAVAALLASRETPQYRATTTLVVAPSSQLHDEADKLRALEALERRSILATFAKIPGTREVREEAAGQLGIAAEALSAYAIRAAVLPHAHVLAIEVTGPDPARCAAVAEAATKSTHARVRRYYPVYTVRLLEAARAERAPFRPRVGRAAGVAGVLGLFLGALAVVAWIALRDGPDGRAQGH